jgi:hypothetical protein
MEVVAQYRDLLHNVLAHLGHLSKEEEREEARDTAEAGKEGTATVGVSWKVCGCREGGGCTF